jgi:hypothetical protein
MDRSLAEVEKAIVADPPGHPGSVHRAGPRGVGVGMNQRGLVDPIGLIALFVVVGVGGAAWGWLDYQREQARRQQIIEATDIWMDVG